MLFFIEFWERFGFYGLQAVLAMFFVKALNMADAQSFIVFGAFSAMVYGYVSIGGYIGDKVLGNQRMYYNVYAAEGGKASQCLACGQCESVCPQHLPIIENLVKVAETFEK